MSQTDGRTYFDFSHHQGDVSQFAFVVVATGHQVKGGFVSDQLDFDVDSVQDLTFLKRHVQMQASREVHGLTLASQVESLFEALVVGRAIIHVSRRVLVPKDGSRLRLFGLRAVIQQIFQVDVRVGVVGVSNQFVVQRQFDVGKHRMHPVVDGAEVVDVVADGRAVGLDDLGFDQQDRVVQVDVIVPGSRDGKRHRDFFTVDGTEGFVLDPMSRFDVDLGGGERQTGPIPILCIRKTERGPKPLRQMYLGIENVSFVSTATGRPLPLLGRTICVHLGRAHPFYILLTHCRLHFILHFP